MLVRESTWWHQLNCSLHGNIQTPHFAEPRIILRRRKLTCQSPALLRYMGFFWWHNNGASLPAVQFLIFMFSSKRQRCDWCDTLISCISYDVFSGVVRWYYGDYNQLITDYTYREIRKDWFLWCRGQGVAVALSPEPWALAQALFLVGSRNDRDASYTFNEAHTKHQQWLPRTVNHEKIHVSIWTSGFDPYFSNSTQSPYFDQV